MSIFGLMTQARKCRKVSLGPLSQRIDCGLPRTAIARSSSRVSRRLGKLVAVSSTCDCRVKLSIAPSTRNRWLAWVTVNRPLTGSGPLVRNIHPLRPKSEWSRTASIWRAVAYLRMTSSRFSGEYCCARWTCARIALLAEEEARLRLQWATSPFVCHRLLRIENPP